MQGICSFFCHTSVGNVSINQQEFDQAYHELNLLILDASTDLWGTFLNRVKYIVLTSCVVPLSVIVYDFNVIRQLFTTTNLSNST